MLCIPYEYTRRHGHREKRNRRCNKGLQETCRSKDENTKNIPDRIFKMSDAVEEKNLLMQS